MDLDFVLAIGNPSLTHQSQVKKEQGEHSQYGTPWSYEIHWKDENQQRKSERYECQGQKIPEKHVLLRREWQGCEDSRTHVRH